MKSAAREKRPSKNDAILNDEDSEREQPVVKSAKWAAEASIPSLSSEVIKLQQKVAKLQEKLRKSEENYKNLYQCAREARQRAEQVQAQLIESQDEIERERESADELRTELAEVSTQLEKAMKNEKKIRKNNCEIAREHEVLKAQVADLKKTNDQGKNEYHAMEEKLQERITFLTNQLKRQRDRANEERMRDRARTVGQDTRDSIATKEKLQERTGQASKEFVEMKEKMQARVNFLTRQLEDDRNKANDERAKDRSRIDELTRQVTQYEQWAHQPQYHQLQYPPTDTAVTAADWPEQPTKTMSDTVVESGGRLQSLLQLQLPPPVVPVPAPPPPANVVRIYDREHPTNIFELYRAGLLKSVGIDSAVWQLKSKAHEVGEPKMKEYLTSSGYFDLDCEVCGKKKIAKCSVLRHFFSNAHVEKVKAHGAAVSLAAYQFWFRLLQEAADAPDGATTAEAAAQQGAASAGGEGLAKAIKKEDPA